MAKLKCQYPTVFLHAVIESTLKTNEHLHKEYLAIEHREKGVVHTHPFLLDEHVQSALIRSRASSTC
jgi:hypothetical protein